MSTVVNSRTPLPISKPEPVRERIIHVNLTPRFQSLKSRVQFLIKNEGGQRRARAELRYRLGRVQIHARRAVLERAIDEILAGVEEERRVRKEVGERGSNS